MTDESILDELFAALNAVVMERLDNYSFKIIGAIPSWFKEFFPEIDTKRDELIPGEQFPVLENFLVDAENFWFANESGRLRSGLWVEIERSGNELYLEASAVCLKGKKILLVVANFKEQQTLIQKARENSLSYYNLVK